MKKEYIICAAIWFNTEIELQHSPWPMPNGWTLCGWRHSQIIELYHSMTGKTLAQSTYVQGFLTSNNQFVSRDSAIPIAIESGQIAKDFKGVLTSEDIY